MLEAEQYREARELLHFLLQCRGEDKRNYEEWQSLLDWLDAVLPGKLEDIADHPDYEAEPSEEDLLRDSLRQKIEHNQDYAKKLLDVLLQDSPLDNKLLALDQLAYVEHPQINDTLIRWLSHFELHPLVQFKVLQTLRQRGLAGSIRFKRTSEEVELDVGKTPLAFEEFPEEIVRVTEQVRQISEINDPMLSYFAEEMWREFVFSVYGSSIYSLLLDDDRENVNVWAAALHQAVLEAMGGTDSEDMIEQYGIPSDSQFKYEQAHRVLRGHLTSSFRLQPR